MKVQSRRRSERGQAMLLIALAFVGLVAFVGLAIDAGILFSYIGHLRKAVDTAALSAANQFREATAADDLHAAAKEFILLNMPGTDLNAEVSVYTCKDADLADGNHAFCTEGSEGKRVRVEAETSIGLAFLPIIGFDEVTIRADAESEAASLDLVLIIDNSPSMANDAEPGSPECNETDSCYPFQDVKDAAELLVDGMNFPYDDMAIITFSRFAETNLNFANACDSAADQAQCLKDEIAALKVAEPITGCPFTAYPPDWDNKYTGCMETNHSAALKMAHLQFKAAREDAVWVVVLLSDGVANSAHDLRDDVFPPAASYPPEPDEIGWWCPQDNDEFYIQPYCQDGNSAEMHDIVDDPDTFDADDAARYMGNILGCLTGFEAGNCPVGGGDGAVIFTIGYGEGVINYHPDPDTDPPISLDVGEQLLRYLAKVGLDGNPNDFNTTDDPCFGQANGEDCGNYYFASTEAELDIVFRAIADRIFTRLTQ
jgi:hypothetical protein